MCKSELEKFVILKSGGVQGGLNSLIRLKFVRKKSNTPLKLKNMRNNPEEVGLPL